MNVSTSELFLSADNDGGSREFVARFYEALTQTITPPYRISIDGVWGAGKTAVLRQLYDQLAQMGYPVFWYNPWKYRQTPSVVLAFLQALYLAAADKPFFPDIRRHGALMLQMLVRSGLDGGLKFLISTTSAETLAAWSHSDYQETIRTILQEFAMLLQIISRHHQHKPVMIFVDDLDRCTPAEIVSFLEALQRLFITPGSRAICLCGLDTPIAKHALIAQYGWQGSCRVHEYFRQIFDVTLSMPYSTNITRVLHQYITTLYDWDDPDQQKAALLARIVYTRGLQSHLYRVHQYMDIVTDFHTFLKSHPEYDFHARNDFVAHLFVVKTAWQAVYNQLLETALHRRRATMEQVIQRLIERNGLLAEQEKFLMAYFGRGAPFARERLATWVAKYPMLDVSEKTRNTPARSRRRGRAAPFSASAQAS